MSVKVLALEAKETGLSYGDGSFLGAEDWIPHVRSG